MAKLKTMEKMLEMGGVQRFYTWDMVKKEYKPVRGIPVSLVGGIEGFVYPNNRGDVLYLMEATTGRKMSMSNLYALEELSERIDYLQRKVNEILEKTGVEKLKKTIQELTEQQGISPRYNEDGTLKKGADKELKPGKKRTETFYMLLANGTFEPVEATKVKLGGGYEGFVRRRPGYGWEVSEIQTGVKIVTAGTRAEAVALAKEKIKKHPDLMKENVEKLIRQYGRSPYFGS